LADLLARPRAGLQRADIALLNLLCAAGLPGAENLEITRLLDKLDDWADLVRLETSRNYYKFINAPQEFNHSQAYFCVLCMITVLQQQCGVRYNPKWTGGAPDKPVPPDFGKDARDLFIHAIIDGPGGTCGSLPVLYAAVGRRLGYPLRIVKAERQLFLRWDDPRGNRWFHPDRFNIEATGPGVHCLPDEHYRTWPHEVPPEDIEAGIFLKSLTPREELAEFIAARAYCIVASGALADAIKTMRWAVELAPHNNHFRATRERWESHRKMLVRGHTFLSNPVGPFSQEPQGARWVPMPNGQKMLVQVLRPGRHLPLKGFLGTERPVVRGLVRLPNGQYAEAELPLHGSGPPMEAHWMPLPGGEYGLVHRPKQEPVWRDYSLNGHPILPGEQVPGPWAGRGPQPSRALPAWEQNALMMALQQAGPRPGGIHLPALGDAARLPGPHAARLLPTLPRIPG